MSAKRTFWGSCVLALLGIFTSCHHSENTVAPADAWQFTGGVIFELYGGSLPHGIYVINPEEANPAAHCLFLEAGEPRISPDGKKLLQYRQPHFTDDLFVSKVDGTEWRNITNTDSSISESDADWSPDMKHVVCKALFYPSFKEALRLVNLSDSAVNDLTDTAHLFSATMPRWSPDGTKVAYIAQDFIYGPMWLTVISADGTSEHRYVQSGGNMYPLWSPDGQKLAHTRASGMPIQLEVLDLPSGQSTPLSAGSIASGSAVSWLTKDQLVYGSFANGLYQVIHASLTPAFAETTIATGFRSLDALVLSSGKDRLALIGRKQEAELSLYLMALDGSGLRRVATIDPSEQALEGREGYIGWGN